jgi:alkylated DNA repair dioxygenase AlkB
MRFRGKKKSGFQDTVAAGNVMLSFYLEHGDIVIMHGTKIHQHYEVS